MDIARPINGTPWTRLRGHSPPLGRFSPQNRHENFLKLSYIVAQNETIPRKTKNKKNTPDNSYKTKKENKAQGRRQNCVNGLWRRATFLLRPSKTPLTYRSPTSLRLAPT